MNSRNMRMSQGALQEFFQQNRVREYDNLQDSHWVNVPFYYGQPLPYNDRHPVNVRKVLMSESRASTLGLTFDPAPEDVILSQGGNDFMRMQKRIMFPLGITNGNATAYTYEYLVEWFDKNGGYVTLQHLDDMFPARTGPPHGQGCQF